MNANAISNYQMDTALILSDDIAKATGEHISVERIVTLLVHNGVVSDYTWWKNQDKVVRALGFDFDMIWEVAP